MVSVLGIDTSAAACSAALWRDGAIVARERLAMARGHAEALMPMIERIMRGTAYESLDAVAVTAGPGAFTGLRIGLAAARGIALAAGIPAIGVSAFAAIAAAIPNAALTGRALAVAIDTKRGDVYLQGFDEARRPLGLGRVAGPGEIAALLPQGPLHVAGDGAALVAAALAAETRDVSWDGDRAPPDAAAVAALGAELLQAARRAGAPLPPPEPLYLRAPEATPLALQGKPREKSR
jgi:tRNA threonylcarbamoyladenosine biosynthesis protein TsaB